jgi:hypothetical protein
MVQDAREIDGTSVGEVTTVREIKTEQGISRLQQGQIDRGVGRSARVWLDVGPDAIENLFAALSCEVFGLIYVLASTIVALAGQPLSVLVVQHRTGCLEDSP